MCAGALAMARSWRSNTWRRSISTQCIKGTWKNSGTLKQDPLHQREPSAALQNLAESSLGGLALSEAVAECGSLEIPISGDGTQVLGLILDGEENILPRGAYLEKPLGLTSAGKFFQSPFGLRTGEGEQHRHLVHISAHTMLAKEGEHDSKALTEPVQRPVRGDQTRDMPVVSIQGKMIVRPSSGQDGHQVFG